LKAAAGALGVAHDKLAVALTTHALIVNGQTSLKHLGHDESSNNTDTVNDTPVNTFIHMYKSERERAFLYIFLN
jgi:ABC-type iron transport system FetAB ATPase subunit